MKTQSRFYLSIIFSIVLLNACTSTDQQPQDIKQVVLNDASNFYYVDVKSYPQKNNSLPIGVFDSGTGGLTVLDAIVNFDKFNNTDHSYTSSGDDQKDFSGEYFIYLGDDANMPYGEYSGNNKTDLLKEHIIKDVQFLLSENYYETPEDDQPNKDKSPVKAIVIACNTATAYGKEDIEKFLDEAGLDIKVIGVIGAGVRGALQSIEKDEDATVGVMATYGTVCSDGYPETIKAELAKQEYTGDVTVFQQSGIGLAGAIDGASDYIDKSASECRVAYKGPAADHFEAVIDTSILARYGFDWSNNNMLFEGSPENPINIQINSVENYIAYHVTSLMEQIRNSGNAKPLKSVILGCTHYPFYTDEFEENFTRLYNYTEDGKYIYKDYMNEKVELVDPSVTAAKELYEYLAQNDMFNNQNMSQSEFYISVPNTSNPNIVVDEKGDFTYDYKYGRDAGMIQEYVKVVPFSKTTLDADVVERLSSKIPYTFELISTFNHKNDKTKNLSESERL